MKWFDGRGKNPWKKMHHLNASASDSGKHHDGDNVDHKFVCATTKAEKWKKITLVNITVARKKDYNIFMLLTVPVSALEQHA